MFNLNDIMDFKTNTRRIAFPKSETRPGFGSLIFLISPSVEDNIKLIKNPILNFNNLFKFIYKDYKIKTKIFNKPFNVNYIEQRRIDYSLYDSKLSGIMPSQTFISVKSKNLIIDTTYPLGIFFGFKKTLVKQVYSEFISLLKSIIQDEKFKDIYQNKYMLIDVNQWNVSKNEITKNNILSNPLSILYIAMKRDVKLVKELGNIDIVITNGSISLFKFNVNKLTDRSYNDFKREINKLKPNIISETIDELEDESSNDKQSDFIEHEEKLTLIKNRISQSNKEKLEDDNIKEVIYAKINDVKDDEDNPQDIIDKIENDENLIKEIQEIQGSTIVSKSNASMARDKELREAQKKIKLSSNKTLDEVLNEPTLQKIEINDVSDKINTLNSNIKNVYFPNFEKSYNKKNYEKDIVGVVANLSNKKELPVFIRKIEKVDSSDSMNQKETITFHLEDGNRVRHTLSIDIPKFIDEKFLYLGGNKKMFVKQLFLKPLVKIAPDVVQVCTNYNKIFMYRYGTQVSPKIDTFKKIVGEHPEIFEVVRGNGFAETGNVKTTIEYDSLAKDFISIKVKKSDSIFIFSQNKILEIIKSKPEKEQKDFEVESDYLRIGFQKDYKLPMVIHTELNQSNEITADDESDGDNINLNPDIIDRIISLVDKIHGSNYYEKIQDSIKIGKRYMYTRCKVMKKNIPTIILLSYYEGLSTVLRKAGVEHYFTDKRPTSATINKQTQGVVEFADGYLVFQRYPISNSLLLNAFALIPTKLYKYEDFDNKTVYLDIFDLLFESRILASGLDAYYDNMIDNITKEILEQMNYPTDFVSLMLVASSLLSDNNYTSEIDMNVFRVRSNEMVAAHLHKIVGNAYSRYKRTSTNKNPVKISVPKDILIKQLLTDQVVEDYSILNPIVETEKSRAITSKGPSGINQEHAYSEEKRSFHETMSGLLAISTSPDGNAGVVRELTLEPNIIGTRGFIDVKSDPESNKDANLFSTAELLTPMGITRDDSIRSAMASKQSKHIVPVSKMDPVLISNGVEKVLPYHLSSDFTIVAKYDGVIKSIDKDTNIMIIEYNNPEEGEDKYKMIDLSPVVVKNGAGGFYLSNTLQSEYKVGQKFKKNDVIAYNKNFFGDYSDGVKFNIGTLSKVACMSGYDTYEDSTVITAKLSNKMATEVIMEKHVVLGPNATVDYLVKKGDKVEVGDPLIRFEQSKVDDSINKLLSDIGKDLQEEIVNIGKTSINSKYTGVIEDVKIYSTMELDELSPSLRKIVSGYYGSIKKKRDLVKKYKIEKAENTANTYTEIDEKVIPKNGKVKGYTVEDGVLIEFYIKYYDPIAVGDKIVHFAALKSIVGEIVPEGKEPFSEYRPKEEISTVFPPGGVLARMVPSALITMFTNKLLVELRRQLGDIYFDGKYDYTKEF